MSEYSEKTKINHYAIKKALIDEWDPIGVRDIPEAQGEYDSYVSTICKMLLLNKSKSEIFDYLWWLETEHMGLIGDKKKTEGFAERLLDLFSEYH